MYKSMRKYEYKKLTNYKLFYRENLI